MKLINGLFITKISVFLETSKYSASDISCDFVKKLQHSNDTTSDVSRKILPERD